MSTRMPLLTMACVGVLAVSQLGAQTGAWISGKIVDQDGVPSAAATVLVTRLVQFEPGSVSRVLPGEERVNTGIRTTTQGEFAIKELPAGEYYVCVIGSSPDHLDSCRWGASPMKVHLAPGEHKSEVNVALRRGVIINFHLHDHNKRILRDGIGRHDETGHIVFGRTFRLGVITDEGQYVSARLENDLGVELVYSVVVPKGAEVRVLTDYPTDEDGWGALRVTDMYGRSLPAREPSEVIVAGVEGNMTFNLTVE